jgi:membrane-associated phospholipid phosphatase
MRALLCSCLLGAACFAQTDAPASAGTDDTRQQIAKDQNQQPDPQQPPPNGAGRSVLQPKPAPSLIKPNDLYDQTGYWGPFARMPKYVLMDQKAIWTSPFHTSKKNVKYWVIWGSVIGGLIAADKHIESAAPNNSTLRNIGTDASYFGQAYSLLPIAAGLYFAGTAKSDDHFREVGLMSFEAVADTGLLQLVLKPLFSRARPTEGDGNGHFWDSSSRINAGFPSGHSINTFAMASVIAHEYHQHLWVKLLCYGYGAGVAAARLSARRHFPSDVVAGGVMGWFAGDYVYGKRHNPDLDERPGIAQWMLEHVHVGMAVQ